MTLVFCAMPPERLTIGCGLFNPDRSEGSHPNQEGLLRDAAIKLLCTILTPEQNDHDDEEVAIYKKVCKELRQQNDGHFLSMVTSLVLAILTGRTDLCVSGVFGAGKTRAAAALIAGLMIMEPALNLMVMTKLPTISCLCNCQARYMHVLGGSWAFWKPKKGHHTKLPLMLNKRNEMMY